MLPPHRHLFGNCASMIHSTITRFFFTIFAAASISGWAQAREIIFEEGIEYSNPNGEHLQVNLARPTASSEKHPAVLCIHGGGFRAGKRERWDNLCKQLAERGYVAATVTYRLAPKYPYPAAIHDVKAAVRWLRGNASK